MTRARDKAATYATAALLAAAAAWCVPLAGGYFLSDDFVQLANFAHWSERGVLGDEVVRRFAGSIDGANAFWRPLTYATFAASYAAGGADAAGWLVVNLALHVSNAVLAALVVRGLAPGSHAHRAGVFAGLLFFALASGWEAALWIAGRYDVLATFFVLLAGWLHARERPWLALFAAGLALLSKESGAVAVVLVACLAIAREVEAAPRGRFPLGAIALRLWPFALLGLAYAGVRFALFGNVTRAYGGPPVDFASPDHWRNLWGSALAWSRAVFPGPPGMRPLAALAAIALLAMGIALGRHQGPQRWRLPAILCALAITSALMLTHLRSFDPSGIGGRLLYLPGALFAIALGLSLASAFESGGGWRAAAGALAGVSLVAHVHWMIRAAEEYRAVHAQMRAVATGVREIAAAGAGTQALLLVPDVLGRAPFGRNAQAGLMLPPVQPTPLTARVLVQLDTEIGEIPSKISRGVFDFLARRSLFELPPGNAPLPGAADVEPSAYFCWHAGEKRFVRTEIAATGRNDLAARIGSAYAAAGCRARAP